MEKGMTKEQDIIHRLFKLISDNHFDDYKMIPTYHDRISFPRQLGDDVADYIQSNFPEYYDKKRKEYKKGEN